MNSQRTCALTAVAVGAALIARETARRRRAMDFAGKVIVITGGLRGLGLVLARRFARETLRAELLPEGVRVTTVAPGLMRTPDSWPRSTGS